MPTGLRRPHPNPPGRRRRDIGRGLGAVAVLALLIAGLPAVVIHFAGLPDPSRPPAWTDIGQLLTGPDTGRLLAVVLAAVFWLAWSAFVVLVLLETFALIGRRQPVRLPAFGPMQELVRTLVACVALLSVPATVSLTSPPASPPMLTAALTPAAAPQHAAAAEHHGAAPEPAAHQPDRPARPAADRTTSSTASRPAAAGLTYQVLAMHDGQRDTLWRIAEQHLRDPLRWPEIFQLNAGRPQPDGAALTDPHWIRPGWLLLLPADATNLPGTPTTASPPAPLAPPPAAGALPTPAPPPSPPSPVAPAAPVAPHRAAPASPIPPTTPAPDRTESQPAARAPSAAERAPLQPTSGPHSSAPPPQHSGPAQGSADGAQQALVATSLASGLAAALLINRQRRRRAYRPRPPQPFAFTAAPPLPAALRRLTTANDFLADDDDDNDDAVPSTAAAGAMEATRYPLKSKSRGDPAAVEVAHRDGTPILLDLLAQPGLFLDGQGAEEVLRSLLVTLLVTSRRYGLTLLVTADVLQALLPGAHSLDAVRVLGTADRAVAQLQTAVLTRTRQFGDVGAADLTGYRRRAPEDPMPLLVLVTGALSRSTRATLDAVLAAGQPLGLAALLLDDRPDEAAGLHISAGGIVTDAAPAALHESLHGAQAFGLSWHEAAAALSVIAEGQVDPAPDPADQHTAATTAPKDTTASNPAPAPLALAAPAAPPAAAPIGVQLLGPYRISAWGQEITTGLRATAKELLAYYLLHPAGATAEAAIDALWPHVSAERGRQRFWTALGNLRSRLREAAGDTGDTGDMGDRGDMRGTGDTGGDIITKVGERYQVQDDVLSADLWAFQAALGDAHRGAGGPSEAGALQRAVELYGGDFADGASWLWAESTRGQLHRSVLDAMVRLAEIHTRAGEHPAAVGWLQRAVELDPYAEEIYRRLITAHVAGGAAEAARATYGQLVGRLADVDLEPDDETVELINRVTRPARRRRAADSRRQPQRPGH